MRLWIISRLLPAGLISFSAFAAAPPDAPSGTAGLCNDGTYSSAEHKQGACRGHKGVKEWYSDTSADAGAAAPAKSQTTAGSSTSTAARPSASTKQNEPSTTERTTAGRDSGGSSVARAPGGGAGKVWANTSTKVYHCAGDKYYGTTKHGEYMSESEAKAKGFHADHNKGCA
jgi:hypothetical protein